MAENKLGVLDHMNALIAPDGHGTWAALGNDTITLAVTNNRVRGTQAIQFDKTDGAANTIYAGISRVCSFDLSKWADIDHASWWVYCSSIADVAYSFLRLGDTTGTNQIELQFPDTRIDAGKWTFCSVPKGAHTVAGGAGTYCNFAAITHMAVGVAFDAQDDALANIAVDEIRMKHAGLYIAA